MPFFVSSTPHHYRGADYLSILTAADHFQLPDLAAMAVDRLGQTITAENVAARLIVADKHS